MGKKTKVVVDTNVIVSAFGWHGKPEEILRLINKGEIENYTSIDLLHELRRVIAYPKFNFPETLQAEIVETIFSMSAIVDVTEKIHIITEDSSDNKILECAVSAAADYIITGDKHLIGLKNFRGIEVLSPEDFFNKL